MSLTMPGPTSAACFIDEQTKDEPYIINILDETWANANIFYISCR